jgi:hypothetical protein
MFLNQSLKSIQLTRIQLKRIDQKLPWRSFWTLHPLGPVDPKEKNGHGVGHQQRGYQPGEEFIFIGIVHLAKGLID